jgi:hypothetical protein
MIITKNRDTSTDWWVYHESIGNTKYLELNTTIAGTTNTGAWNNTSPDSDVFTLGSTSPSNANQVVAYCFSEVAGYSKFGSYTGNGSTSGPTVTTGFRPAFVMVKRTDTTQNWGMYDNTRNPSNPVNLAVFANASTAEDATTNDDIEFTDTGFQMKNTGGSLNASGGTYIYMAFADTRDAQFNFDASGNKNNWTANNINSNASSETTYDIMNDVPTLTDEDTGNFCTLNPLDVSYPNNVYSNGNLDVSWTNTAGGISGSAFGSIGVNTGKWVFEATVSSYTGSSTLSVGWWGTSYLTRITPSANGVYTVAIDFDNQLAWFATNGTWTGDPEAGTGGTSITVDTSIPYFPLVRDNSGTVGNGAYFAANFGQRPFKYTPPTGYKKLNTYNLPDSTIVDGSQYFNTVTYTGDGGTSNSLSYDFSPDFVWSKSRSNAQSNILYDSIRGTSNYLLTNSTNAEATVANPALTFDSNGHTWIYPYSASNLSGYTYVNWNWRGSDSTAVSNTDGTITSTVSANTDSGFSVVTWTGSGNSSDNVGTGLSSSISLSMAIIKRRDSTSEWYVGHIGNVGLNFAYHLELNSTAASSGSSPYFMGTQPSNGDRLYLSSGALTSGATYVAYCFQEVEGFSKFGSYTGNGSTDGPFVYTGFRPAFVLIKRTDAGPSNWTIQDTSRDIYNVADGVLYPNVSNAETTSNAFDMLSNGFKLKNSTSENNASGATYIYTAFAENPFKQSLAR